jgi:hypothetical protein
MPDQEPPAGGGPSDRGGPEKRTKVSWRGVVDEGPGTEQRPGAVRRVAAVLGLDRPGSPRSDAEGPGRGPRGPGLRRLALLVLVVLLGAEVLSMVEIVPAGSVAVPVTFGSAGAALGEGFHLTAPWPITTTAALSVQTQNYSMSAADDPGTDDPVLVLGRDGASGAVDATVLYRLDPDRAEAVYRELGADYFQKVVRPSARSCIRVEFATENKVRAVTESLREIADPNKN